jgi:hypothetical protein
MMPRQKLRNSERQTYINCRQKWWWAYGERWQPKVAGPALRFGTLIHQALELRYPPGTTRGPHPALSFERLYQEELAEATRMGFRDEDGKWMDAGELGVAMMTGFVEEYGDDDEWEVISSEMAFRTRISEDVTMVGRLDGVWRSRRTDHLLMVDWKTTAQFWGDFLPMDEQAGVYWAFAPAYLRKHGILRKGQSMKGILYTFLRKAMPDDRPKNDLGQSLNKDGTVSKRQPNPLFERHVTYRDRYDREQIRARVIEQAREMQLIKEGQLAVYKAPSIRNCGGCAFRNVCEMHETGADYAPLLRSFFQKHDPYDSYHLTEEGRESIHSE